MRTFFRSLLVGLLIVALIDAPAVAAPAPAVAAPLGVILQGERARVGGDSAANGTTIFDGDRLETDESGRLQVRFGLSQAYFLASSTAVVHRLAPGFAADLMSGTVVLSSGQGERFRVLADGAMIQPSTAQPTVAQVSWVSANELLLASRKGALEVSMGDEVKTIPDGTSYRMLIEPSAGQGSGSSASPTGKNKFILVVIALVIAATVTAVVLAVETPAKPR